MKIKDIIQPEHLGDECQERAPKRRRVDEAGEVCVQGHDQADQEAWDAGRKSHGSVSLSGNASLWQGDHYGPQINHYHYNSIAQSTRESKCKILLESLAFDRMDARLHNVADALPNTCLWLQSHEYFRSWADASQTNKHGGFLWIKGKPGSGKSTIMKATLAWAEQAWSTQVILTYFFNARSPDWLEKSSLGLYRSLVHQLLTSCPDDQLWLVKEFASKERQGKVVVEWTEIELQNFLTKVLTAQPHRQITLFIDALDEGHDNDVRDMIDYLESLMQHSASLRSNVRVCFASRHYPHITTRKGLSIVLEQQAAHEHDIESYVFNKLIMSEDPKMDELRDQVCARSSGVFLWVVLVVSSLNRSFDQGKSPLRMLRHLEDIPQNLHDMFASIFARDRDNIDETITLLRWVLFALEPLHPSELYTAVQRSLPENAWDGSMPTDDALRKYLLNCSRGLIEITLDDQPVVVFIHETVRDFLLGKSTPIGTIAGTREISSTLPDFQVDRCHLTIAEECLQYLLSCNNDAHPSNVVEQPLAQYAAEYWWQHIQASTLEWGSRLSTLAYTLFGSITHLLTWVQHYDALDTSSRDDDPLTSDDLAPRLHYAAAVGLAKIAKFLLDQGVDVNASEGYYGTALQIVSIQGYAEVAQLLLEHGANVNSNEGRYGSALNIASARGYERIVQMLLDRDANVNKEETAHGTPLQSASESGHAQVVRLLLDKGADVNIDSETYGTALQAASAHGHEHIVQMLLDKNADVNVYSETYGTALQAASAHGHGQILQMLLNKGAYVNIHDEILGNALYMASCHGHAQIVKTLLNRGAHVNARGGEHVTALQAASTCGHEEIVQMLLDKGANVNILRWGCLTALEAAWIRGHTQITQILIAYGAESDFQKLPLGEI